jgi:hypothetical protein
MELWIIGAKRLQYSSTPPEIFKLLYGIDSYEKNIIIDCNPTLPCS